MSEDGPVGCLSGGLGLLAFVVGLVLFATRLRRSLPADPEARRREEADSAAANAAREAATTVSHGDTHVP